jgi:hypothetical protein
MKTRTIFLTLALCFAGVAVVFAQDANMGTWTLNETKSTFAAGATKNTTVRGEGCSLHPTVAFTWPFASTAQLIVSMGTELIRHRRVRVPSCTFGGKASTKDNLTTLVAASQRVYLAFTILTA